MDAKDLMIGNFMLYNDDVCIIDEIRVDNTVVLTALNTDVTSIDGDQVSTDEILPIPLTPEILEKNGFKKANYIEVVGGLDTYYLGEEIGSFRIHRLQEDYYQFGLAKIKYVHQLQHALRLCGIDKEIEI